MSDHSEFEHCNSLEEWESALKEWLRKISLLGEIPLNDSDINNLEKLLSAKIKKEELLESIDKLTEQFPTCLATYLTFCGITKYISGDFWTGVSEGLGIPKNNQLNSDLGEWFVSFLKSHNLTTFEIPKSLKYVTPILAHAGIPNSCLQDFFMNVIVSSIDNGYDIEDIIENLKDGSVSSTNKPVWRYLAYGGKPARDFLDRCLEMGRQLLETDEKVEHTVLDLPERVVNAFIEWLGGSEHKADNLQDKFLRPQLQCLLPYKFSSPYIVLPPQKINVKDSKKPEIVWKIGGEHVIEPRLYFNKSYIETEKLEIPIDYHEKGISVELFENNSLRKKWLIPSSKFFVFNPDTGQHIEHWSPEEKDKQYYLYCETALILSDESLILGETGMKVIEKLPPLDLGWQLFQAKIIEIDIKECKKITFTSEDKKEYAIFCVPPEVKPELSGGSLVYKATDAEGTVSYYSCKGGIPSLTIPRIKDNSDDELLLWRVSIRSIGESTLEQNISYLLSQLINNDLIKKENFTIPLADSRLLGETPCGEFFITIRGPLGNYEKFRIRILPFLQIEEQEKIIIPDPENGHQPHSVLIRTDHSINIEAQEEYISVEEITSASSSAPIQEKVFKVTIPSDKSLAYLNICTFLSNDKMSLLPLYLRLHRLWWRFQNEPKVSSIEWRDKCIDITSQELQGSSESRFFIRSGQQWDNYPLKLSLVHPTGQELHTSDLPLKDGDGSIYLSVFSDTIYQSGSAKYQVKLNIVSTDDKISLQVVSITTAVEIEDFKIIEFANSNDNTHIAISWKEKRAVKNKFLRIWNLWRPWEKPVIEIGAPDNSNDLNFNTKKLIPGNYLFQFVVKDEWSQTRSLFYEPNINIFDNKTIPVEQEQWPDYIEKLPGTILGSMERFFAFYCGNQTGYKTKNINNYSINKQEVELLLKGLLWCMEKDPDCSTAYQLWDAASLHLASPIHPLLLDAIISHYRHSRNKTELQKLLVILGAPQISGSLLELAKELYADLIEIWPLLEATAQPETLLSAQSSKSTTVFNNNEVEFFSGLIETFYDKLSAPLIAEIEHRRFSLEKGTKVKVLEGDDWENGIFKEINREEYEVPLLLVVKNKKNKARNSGPLTIGINLNEISKRVRLSKDTPLNFHSESPDFIIGMIALTQRLLASTPWLRQLEDSEKWRLFGVKAFQLDSEKYLHDLILFNKLLISEGSKEEKNE